MNTKSFLIILCLFCAAVLSAQNNTFIQIWEQQARSRGASWNTYTRAATAAGQRTYTSLYVNGQLIASFNNAGTCHAKISELKNLAENMYGKQSDSSSSRRDIKLDGDAIRDLERVSGVNVRSRLQKANNEMKKLTAEIYAQNKQRMLSQIDGYCSCRTENNPNYDPNAKATGYDDLFTSDANNETDSGIPSNSLFADNPQTQYENIFDAPSARTPQQTNTGEKVSLNFDRGGLPVVDPNWTSDRLMREKDPIYLPDNSSWIEEYGKWREKWENLPDSITDTSGRIYVNPDWRSDWLMQREESPSLPDSSEYWMKEYEKRKEKINSQPFDMEVLQYKKQELESKLSYIAENCDKSSEFACMNELKSIADKIDVLQKRIDGRTEWLDKVNNMSNEILVAQERNTAKVAEMAGLAAASYANYEERGGIPKGWTNETSSTGFETILLKVNNEGIKSGFHCELFKNKDGDYVLSFRGTDDIQDAVKAWGQGNLYLDEQTQSALKITKDIIKELEDKGIPRGKLQLTGHSLGGRLAAEAAIEHNLTSYTFDSADVSLETRKGDKVGKSGNIINTVAANDFLTGSTFGLGNLDGGINYNWSSNMLNKPNVANTVIKADIVNKINVAKEIIGIRTGTYSPGYTNVVKEVYGNGQIDGHSILLLRQALEQRHQDIVNKQNNIAQ
jgi:hypothetical protein